MLTAASLWSIDIYQRRISPRKGFSCAYRVAHGGTGCSGYIKQRIAEVGLIRAIPDIRARFAACRQASEDINGGRRRQRRGGRDGDCDIALCGLEGADCGADACGLFRSSRAAPRNCGPDDCGDCGPGDCGPGDCGGCG